MSIAFWCACHGGQIGATEYLLDRGADRDWIGHDGLTPLDAAHRSGRTPSSTAYAIAVRAPLESWTRAAAAITLSETMIRRSLLILAVLYLVAAVTGLARERRGTIACGCHEGCWCKRPGVSLVRWVFPFGHRAR